MSTTTPYSLTFNPFGSVTVPFHHSSLGTTQATVVFVKIMSEVVVQIRNGIPTINGIDIQRVAQVLGHEVIYHACNAQGGYKEPVTPTQTPIKPQVPNAPRKDMTKATSPSMRVKLYLRGTVYCQEQGCMNRAVIGPSCGHHPSLLCQSCWDERSPFNCMVACNQCKQLVKLYYKGDLLDNEFHDDY